MTYNVCSSRIISEMLPEIHIMEKCDFLKSITHSQIIIFSVKCARDTIYKKLCLTSIFSLQHI